MAKSPVGPQSGSDGGEMGQNLLHVQLWSVWLSDCYSGVAAWLDRLVTWLSTCSGTYNNQYMVLDRSKIKLGHSIDDGALTVVEQIPGFVQYSDQTQALRRGNTFVGVFLWLCIINLLAKYLVH